MKRFLFILLVVVLCGEQTQAQFSNKNVDLSGSDIAGMVNTTQYNPKSEKTLSWVGTITKEPTAVESYVFGSSAPARYLFVYDPTPAYDVYVALNKAGYQYCYESGPYGDCTLSKALSGYKAFFTFVPLTVFTDFQYIQPDYLKTLAKSGALYDKSQADPTTEHVFQWTVIRSGVGFTAQKK
ncbi:MAG: hypothetical protein U0Y10_10980 [Spirosomataceae bacterium]